MTMKLRTGITMAAAVAVAVAVALAGPLAAGAAPTVPTVPIPTVPPPTVAPTAPLPTAPSPTIGVPTVPTSPGAPTTTPGPTLPTTSAAAATGTVISDDTGRITVTVPAAWTDTDTRPSTRDDGGKRPTISASPNLDEWTQTWAVPGLFFVALPPTVDPATLIEAYTWRNSCDPGPITPYNDGRYVGSLLTWSNCGGGATSLTVLAARSADSTYTIYAQIQVITPNDPALQQVLGTMGAVPGANPGEITTVVPLTAAPPAAPATLLTGVVAPGSTTVTDETGQLSIAVDPTWADVGGVSRANDDFSVRPYLVAAPDRDLYFQEWDAAGLEFGAFPYRADPYPLVANQGWPEDCDDGGVQGLTVRGYSGLMQTWTNCGGTGSRIIIIAVSPADQSITLYLEIQLPTTDDTPLITALSSFAYTPG